ncbi:MAG: [protein-PII] uridylyltransferase [Acidobacteria bacterium]|nr:[protein-PII] uridylyltransferase [Acidobacteriota bacterium]
MHINFETIEKHAGEKLRRIERQATTEERLVALKKFIKTETQRLYMRHRFGLGGELIASARSLIVDLMIQRLAQMVSAKKSFDESSLNVAIVALGGYGRQELAPYSDIDLLFVHGRGDLATAETLNEEILYLLWDTGFSVGHSVRSLNECLTAAKEDAITRNALLDARLLWGSRELFKNLTAKLDETIVAKNRRTILDELAEEQNGRYAKFGAVPCLQEPNIKESAGGLRDLHSLLWATRVAYGYSHLANLATHGFIPERDVKAILGSYDFLLRVRNALHFLTGRKTDLLTLDLQVLLARDFGYQDTPEQRASELFMRDYYLHARRLHRLTRTHLQQALSQPGKSRWLSRLRNFAALGGFVMRDGALEVQTENDPWDASKLMLAFSYGQATGASLSATLQERIQENLPLVNRVFRSSPEIAQAFLKVLRVKGKAAAALRQMHEMDFLGKYLPEFGRVTCLVQHDLYHKYTVDEHTLRTIEVLDELYNSRARSSERYRQLYSQIEDPAILHLGLLFHDIGKGLGGGHTEKGLAIAERVCNRLHLEDAQKKQIRFLVKQHLTMSHIAQRRDLSDEKVIQDFAGTVKTLENLNLLTLLTYADINAVGPGVWNEWKDALLWELYLKARAIFVPEPQAGAAVEQLRNHIALMLASEIGIDEVHDHFHLLPEDYARVTLPQTIIEHIRLAHSLNSRMVRTSWRVNTQSRCTDLHICARNRRGFLAAIAGTLTAQGVNILSVHLNTRADGVVVDSFKVCDTVGEPLSDPLRWEQIDDAIKRALSGELDVATAVEKKLKAHSSRMKSRKRSLMTEKFTTKLLWDNQSSDKSTILEVTTPDRLGLAYKIANALSALSLDIAFAKVATEKHLALDIFYITDAAGTKLADAALPAIEAAIYQTLGTDEA